MRRVSASGNDGHGSEELAKRSISLRLAAERPITFMPIPRIRGDFRMTDTIEQRLVRAAETGDFRGFLFHGSGESWSGTPHPGGDGLFWMARTPAIAQAYIPSAGSSYIVSLPLEYLMPQRVIPEKHGFWHQAAEQMTGMRCQVDGYDESTGLPTRWSVPEGWPTYARCAEWLEGMGYSWPRPHESIDVLVAREDGRERIMPAGWRLEGTLVVTTDDGLEFRDLRTGDEGDLLSPDHMRYGEFEKAEAAGADGVVINDFAQIGRSNVGHVAYGLTSRGIEGRAWLMMPATRFEPDRLDPSPLTPEVREWASVRRVGGLRLSPSL